MSLTAVFVRPVTAIIVTITSPLSSDTAACVVALELVVSACCSYTHKRTEHRVLNRLDVSL